MDHKSIRQAGFAFITLAGFGLLLLGPVNESLRPHFMLDHVLTPEQLTDDGLRERTLAQLKQAKGPDWTLPSIVGLALIAVGGAGLVIPVLKPRFHNIVT